MQKEDAQNETETPFAVEKQRGVMPVPIKDQCVCCDGKEHVGKYGDTDIDVCEECYRNGNLLKWLSAKNGTEA